mmetsp:Transcript_71663/g.119879  ORF Transcript_71663/g.119879 Transcript_71663/m.119879 type:complete len:244 (-) Transcript_71663:1125-1856(-)
MKSWIQGGWGCAASVWRTDHCTSVGHMHKSLLTPLILYTVSVDRVQPQKDHSHSKSGRKIASQRTTHSFSHAVSVPSFTAGSSCQTTTTFHHLTVVYSRPCRQSSQSGQHKHARLLRPPQGGVKALSKGCQGCVKRCDKCLMEPGLCGASMRQMLSSLCQAVSKLYQIVSCVQSSGINTFVGAHVFDENQSATLLGSFSSYASDRVHHSAWQQAASPALAWNQGTRGMLQKSSETNTRQGLTV